MNTSFFLRSKKPILLLGFLFFVQNIIAQDQPETFSDLADLKYVNVSESVIMLQNDKKYGSNIVCVALDDGLVFFDCSLFKSRAYRFRKDMEEKFNKSTLALVLTHSHIDHIMGMDAFADLPIISCNASQPLIEQQLQINFEQYVEGYKSVFSEFDEALKDYRLFMPNVWFDKEIILGSGNLKIIIRNTGGHSICSSYGYFEKESILIAGDNLQAEYHPYFGDRTGNMPVWIETLQSWERMNITYFCPGHGPKVNMNYLTDTRLFFEDLYNILVELKKNNTPVEEVIKYDKFPVGYWPKELEKPGWYDPSLAFIYNSIVL